MKRLKRGECTKQDEQGKIRSKFPYWIRRNKDDSKKKNVIVLIV